MELIILAPHLWDEPTPIRAAMEAAEIAQEFARRKRIDWGEPVCARLGRTHEGILCWEVHTNWPALGGNFIATVEDTSGEILDWTFHPA